jgi:tetratricopeptide (TPR) repeat protein
VVALLVMAMLAKASRARFIVFALVTSVTAPVCAGGDRAVDRVHPASDEQLTQRVRELTELLRARPLDHAASPQFMELCETREKLFQYHEAARCYEQLFETWPNVPIGRDALWVAAQLYRRLREYGIALDLYTRMVLDPAFDGSRRSDARSLAAMLRRYLQKRKTPPQPAPDPDRRRIASSGGGR